MLSRPPFQRLREGLPDPPCTQEHEDLRRPGCPALLLLGLTGCSTAAAHQAVDPAVTQANLASRICKSGYTTTFRAAASDTNKEKALSLREHGQIRVSSSEYDHLISLQLGGTNAVSNRWPEPNRANAPGSTNPKDAVETKLNKAVGQASFVVGCDDAGGRGV